VSARRRGQANKLFPGQPSTVGGCHDYFSPDDSPDSQELGGTGFPACAKNTLLFRVIKFAVIFQQVILYVKKFMNKAG
jgi:hypothetical protein